MHRVVLVVIHTATFVAVIARPVQLIVLESPQQIVALPAAYLGTLAVVHSSAITVHPDCSHEVPVVTDHHMFPSVHLCATAPHANQSDQEYDDAMQSYQYNIAHGKDNSYPKPTLMVVNARVRTGHPDSLHSVSLFLDCGAQTSLIANSTVQRLGLCVYNHQPLITDVLTTPHQQVKPTIEDVRYITSLGLDPPSRMSSPIHTEILIGIDYFWGVISPEPSICLPSGLVLTHTRFGSVISGSRFFRSTPALMEPPDTPPTMRKMSYPGYVISTPSGSNAIQIPPSTLRKMRGF
ncbi:hypothetical protein OESDEN_23177 [Oesophagostomum dentatum]|uniref:Peptidase aspartic putative domain-containing protein n=1 Tax=Oesophagostomum dentatum TaxID=61180 RepID=A0A0B1RVW4_OESDE|nr:hypothetical protein OESDEN_23177 [Oesophagostomum dentatum]